MSSPSLGRTQAASLTVNVVTTGLLGLQNLAVLVVLTRSELGLLGIASGVGALALLAQYFGVGAATLKEVAVATDRVLAYRAFVAGLCLRLALSLPIGGALFALAEWIASSVYDYPGLATPLRILGGTILLFGVSDVLGYTLQGLQLWRRFFISKLVAAVLQTPAVIGLTVAWGVNGYFAGVAIGGLLAVLCSAAALTGVFQIEHRAPPLATLRRAMREMLGLTFSAHVAKIFQVLAFQLPVLIAGYAYSAAATGDLKFAITLGGLVLSVAGAVNTINMSVFSRSFAAGEASFWPNARRQIVGYAVISGGIAALMGLCVPDLVQAISHGKYAGALELTVLAVAGAALHGLIGVIVSTVHIPIGAHTEFVLLYFVPAAITTVASVAVAVLDASSVLFGAAILVGGAAGVGLAIWDLGRRPVRVTVLIPILVVSTGLAVAPLLGLSTAGRYGLIAIALLGATTVFRNTRSRLAT